MGLGTKWFWMFGAVAVVAISAEQTIVGIWGQPDCAKDCPCECK
jgi:hypothetical protein